MQVRVVWLAGLVIVSAACAPPPQTPSASPAAVERDPVPTRIEVKYAQRYSVEYRGDLVTVRLSAPLTSWSGGGSGTTESRSETIVLVPRDAPPPRLDGELASAHIVRVPVDRVAVNAEADEALLGVIGASGQLVAVGGLSSYDDTVHERVTRGELGQIGYTWHSAPNLEVLVSRKPDVLFMRLVNLDLAESLTRARTLGIPVIPSFAWAEQDYLGQAEWVKLFGLVTGRTREADAYFTQLEARVQTLRALAARQAGQPSVLWAYYAGGQKWIAAHRGIEEQFLRDAGARSATAALDQPWRDGGTAITTERLLALAKDADHWIIGDAHGLGEGTGGLSLPPERVLQLFRPWRDNRLWHNYKRRKPERNAFDWYESHGVWPDRVLEDVISIVHPGLRPGHELYFFDRFDKPTQ